MIVTVKGGRKIHAHRCRFCGEWYLASKPHCECKEATMAYETDTETEPDAPEPEDDE